MEQSSQKARRLMRLAFFKGQTLFSDAIHFRTLSDISHCLFLFGDNMAWTSDVPTHGTAFSVPEDLAMRPHLWEVVDVGDALNEPALRIWCASHLGESYGFVGDFCLLLDVKDFDTTRVFCSQAMTAGANAQGVWMFTSPDRTTPGDLFLIASAIAERHAPHSELRSAQRHCMDLYTQDAA